MKALTILQPWASLIVEGTLDAHGRVIRKDVENRTWPTSTRGRVAIHAGVRKSRAEFCGARMLCHDHDWKPPGDMCSYLFGFVLGTVRIVNCVQRSDSLWFCGPFGFVLEDPILFDAPIPAIGRLGFWEWKGLREPSDA